MIVKPLDGKGGEGIFHLHATTTGTCFSILEQSTAFESRPSWPSATCPPCGGRQAHPAARRRAAGRGPAGAVRSRRHRCEPPRRGQPAETGHPRRHRPRHRRAAGAGPAPGRALLRRNRRDRGPCLTEVNVTSPTGVQEINRLEGRAPRDRPSSTRPSGTLVELRSARDGRPGCPVDGRPRRRRHPPSDGPGLHSRRWCAPSANSQLPSGNYLFCRSNRFRPDTPRGCASFSRRCGAEPVTFDAASVLRSSSASAACALPTAGRQNERRRRWPMAT